METVGTPTLWAGFIAFVLALLALDLGVFHRWGVLGALVMRAIFIVAGAALLAKFHWVMYVFGGILVVTAVKLFTLPDDGIHPERNPAYRLMRRFIPATSEYHGAHFVVKQAGRWVATPLLIVLLLIEWTAVDSIPAIFAITNDPFIVPTSRASWKRSLLGGASRMRSLSTSSWTTCADRCNTAPAPF